MLHTVDCSDLSSRVSGPRSERGREGVREGGRDGESEGRVTERRKEGEDTYCFFLQTQGQYNLNVARHCFFSPLPGDRVPHRHRTAGHNITHRDDQSAEVVILVNPVIVPNLDQ